MAAHQISGLGQRHCRGSVKQHRRGSKGADQEEDVLLFEMNQMSQESDCKNSEKGSNPGNQNFFQQDPPGGATALIAVIGSERVHQLGFLYVLSPVALGALIMLVVALIVNNLISFRRYPVFWW